MDPVSDSFVDDFDAPDLDADVWIPHYLPMWSSRAKSAASYSLDDSALRLSIPGAGPLVRGRARSAASRLGIQSGIFSEQVGSSTRGQQPFRDGLVVREHQPMQWGWTPHYGLLEVRARMDLSPRSMASVWMVGIEDEPERCGEICIFEVFGDALADEDRAKAAAVGMGIHPRPALSEEWALSDSTSTWANSIPTPPTAPRPRRLPDRRPPSQVRRTSPGLPDASDGGRLRLPRQGRRRRGRPRARARGRQPSGASRSES